MECVRLAAAFDPKHAHRTRQRRQAGRTYTLRAESHKQPAISIVAIHGFCLVFFLFNWFGISDLWERQGFRTTVNWKETI
jgi:hypothetical protein